MATTKTPLVGGGEQYWNFSNPDKEGFMETIEGTLVEFSQPQHIDWATKQPAYLPWGPPQLDWKMVIRGRSGRELVWKFDPKSRTKPSAARQALVDAAVENQMHDVEDFLGKFIRISTKSGKWGLGNPRPWKVEVLGDGEADEVRGSIPPAKQMSAEEQAAINEQGARDTLAALDDTSVYTEDEIPF